MAAVLPWRAGKSIASRNFCLWCRRAGSNRRAGDWRLKIESAPPEERETVIAQAVREIGSVLRVKPDSLRDDQPLTDLDWIR